MIDVGLIGYGYWGRNLARCLAEAEDCRLAMIADASAAALGRAQARHPGARTCSDWRELVAAPSVDAVVIATPAAQHFEMANAALAAGKHVLVEKPLAGSARLAAVLVEAAARRGLVLMVDHTFVYTGAVQKIRDLMAQGVVGDLYYYDSTRINLGLFQPDVNVIWDLAVHDLAILDFVLGDSARPLAVSANGAGHIPGSQENMAQIDLYFGGGGTAHLNVNWLAPVKVRRALIGGSRRMVVYDDQEPSEKVKVYDRGIDLKAVADPSERDRLLPQYRMGDVWAPQLDVKEALLSMVEHFVHCASNGLVPLTGGEAGLRVVGILEAASLSLRRRGQPVDLAERRRAS